MGRDYKPTAFARQHLRHQMRWRARSEHGDPDQNVSPMWEHWLDGVHPEVHDAAERVAHEIRLHSHAAALNSSMTFAFNMLLPSCSDGGPLSAALSKVMGETFQLRQIDFEWAPPADVLAEIRGKSPQEGEPFTAIDALAVGQIGTRRTGVFIEVKLTECGFTECGGYISPANQRRDICESAETFLEDPDACYLRRPRRATRDRRYWDIFARAHGSVSQAFPYFERRARCPFIADGQQIMRQHAAALGSMQTGIFDQAWIVLLHHDDNPDVPGPWDNYARASADSAMFRRLPATQLLEAGHPFAVWMAKRYQLGGHDRGGEDGSLRSGSIRGV